MAASPSDTFNAAASWLSTSSQASGQSNTTKLEIYGLYKYVTVSPSPKPGARPGIFDWTGGAKWDAWEAAGKKYPNTQTAEARYMEIARLLGWPGMESSRPQHRSVVVDDVDLDNLDDEDEPRSGPTASASSRGGGGMGVRVSLLAREDSTDARGKSSIHEFAISGDVEELQNAIAHGSDINAKDAYGFTPLHLACDRGNAEVVRVLVQSGAQKDIKDSDGNTPLDIATVLENKEIIQALAQ